MAKKKTERRKISLVERMRKYISAGLEGSPSPNRNIETWDEDLPSIDERIHKMLGIINDIHRKPTNMLFFVMYDIESNKVRSQVVRYLIEKGCTRVQKSIFLADLDGAVYEQIKNDLTEVQAAYDNHDSILIVPFSTDYLRAMKVIGKKVSIDVITHSRSTLFF